MKWIYFKEEQIFFAVDSIKKAVINILENTDVVIDFSIIGGNHDCTGSVYYKKIKVEQQVKSLQLFWKRVIRSNDK